MAPTRWLVSFKPRRPYRAAERWLTETGHFTSDPSKALVVLNAEAAAERLQVFVESRGWPLKAVERLTLVAVRQPMAKQEIKASA
jgi:hypothetical protein